MVVAVTRLGFAMLALLVASPAAAPANLHVRQVVAKGSPLPTEGAYGYVRVVRQDGSKVLQRRLRGRGLVPFTTVTLAPGRYHLLSWQRYCDGNCLRLDPPSDRCARWFRLHRGQRLVATITVRYGSGCRISYG
jgi:hypothetical protein